MCRRRFALTNFADAPALQRSVVEEQRGRDAVAVAWVSSKVAPCVTSVQSMLLQSGAKSRGSMPLQIAYVGDCPIGKRSRLGPSLKIVRQAQYRVACFHVVEFSAQQQLVSKSCS